MCFTNSVNQDKSTHTRSKSNHCLTVEALDKDDSPILPGLPDDVAKYCLALVPRSNFPAMGGVSKKWRLFIRSKEFVMVRKLAGLLEEWLYCLTLDSEGRESHWEVMDSLGRKCRSLPPMPGPAKASFGVVVLNGKLLIMAGYSAIEGTAVASDEVYQYDSYLNSWSRLSNMNVARYDFACAEVNGLVYIAGGYGVNGDNLSSVEMYDPDTDKWTLIESLRRPRWGCFACGFEDKLYVMGGRSSFTIGNSKFVDIYNPEKHSWCEIKNGCVMVTAHAVLEKKLFCIEWKNQRKLAIFSPENNSWTMVPVPLTGSSSVGFRFGILDGKLLLFPVEKEPTNQTLLYDPNAASGSEWQTSDIRPSGLCLCSVTMKQYKSLGNPRTCDTADGENWFEPILGSKWYDDQRVAKVSTRNGRGKHMTRHVSLLPLSGGGYLADTPGFNQPSLLKVTKQSLAQTFPEIRKMLGGNESAKCSFNNCLHLGEPGCIVKGDWERYSFYFQLLDEIRIREEFQLRTFGTKRESDVRLKTGDMGSQQAEPRLMLKKHRRQSRKKTNQSILDDLDDDDNLLDEENDPPFKCFEE